MYKQHTTRQTFKAYVAKHKVYAWTLGIFLISRMLLYGSGMEMVLIENFMHFLDPELLQNRMLESLLYFHAFPPLMNALLGLLLRIFGSWTPFAAQGLFLALGGVMTISLTTLFRVFIRTSWPVVALVSVFMLSPPTLYFELFYFHTYPTAVLLVLSAALFVRILHKPAFMRWFWFFLTLSALCLLRSTMHMIWLLSIFGFVLGIRREHWKSLVGAFIGPFSLVLLFYLKNLLIFGHFGASSWLGNSLMRKTIQTLPEEKIEQLITEGHISPLCKTSIFAPPASYALAFDLTQERGIPALDQLYKSTGGGNFNHWVFLQIADIHMQDGLYGLRHFKSQYLMSVAKASIEHFLPTTRWHPRDAEKSPHRVNRTVIGQYELGYNSVLHNWPISGIGLYLLLLPLCLAGLIQAILQWSKAHPDTADLIVIYAGANSAFILLVGSLFEYGESERFRYQFEALLWIMAIYGIKNAYKSLTGQAKQGLQVD